MEVLFVCTGNICRSPMAAALLRQRAVERGVDVAVSSAGLFQEGVPASAEAVDALTERGLDIESHRSRRVTADMVTSADLVIGMERRHVREAVMLDPPAYGRVFTLKELVRRGAEVGERGHDEPIGTWLERAHAGRQVSDHMGDSLDDDIPDPVGQPVRVFRSTADELDDLLGRLVDLIWQPTRRFEMNV